MSRIHVLAAVLLAAVLLTARPAAAQTATATTATTAAPTAEEPAPAAVRDLARLLADPAVRDWLAKAPTAGLPAGASAEGGGQPMMSARIERMKDRLARLRLAVERFPAELVEAATIMSFELDAPTTLRTATAIAVFLALGLMGEALFRRWTRGARAALADPRRGSFSARLVRTALRGQLALLDVGVFALCSAGVFLSVSWPPIVGLLTFTILLATVVVRLALAVSGRVLSPAEPSLRLVPVGDGTARVLQIWIGVLAAVTVCGVLLTQALHELGLMPNARLAVPCVLGLLAATLLIAFVWRVHAAVRPPGPAEERGEPRIRGVLRDLWPVLATVGIVLIWIVFVVGAVLIGWTLVVIGLTATLIPLIRSAVDAAAGVEGEEAPLLLPTVRRAAGVSVLLAGVVTLASIWGVDLVGGDGGSRVVHAAFHLAVALLIADLIWSAARAVIDHRLGGRPTVPGMPDESEGGAVAGPEARLKTLLPLVRTGLLLSLVTVVGLVALSALGIDIAPFLAGAGILGLAIGFGAQALVRDIVSGFFFLVEDAFRIGEYVEFGSLRGTVEGISLRSMRLRHHLGAVHTVPYGEIKSLTNHSRDWTIVRMEFRLPFDTDLTQVRKIIKRIGAEMAADPEYAPDFLMPLKSQGVRRWEEFNMVVGVKFCTRPGKQWVIRRDAYQRIRDAFTAAGIHFASRDVTVRVSPGASPAEVEAAAAQAAMEAGVAPAPAAATAASR